MKKIILNKDDCHIENGCIASLNNTFINCINFDTELVKIIIPSKIGDEDIRELASSLFKGLKNITEIEIKNGIEIIDAFAFAYLENLKILKLPDTLMYLQNSVFQGDKALEHINLPNNLVEISDSTFRDCFKLKSVTWPENLMYIRQSAFTNCHTLKNLSLPNGLITIGNAAFEGCKNLQSVILPDTIQNLEPYAFMDCKRLETINIPNLIECINNNTFDGCIRLKNITFPHDLVYSETFAFEDTEWLKNKRKENSIVIVNNVLIDAANAEGDIIISDGVKIIPDNAFYNKYEIFSITIPNSVKCIESSAFAGNKDIVLYYDGTKKEFNKIKRSFPLRKKYNWHYAEHQISTNKNNLEIYEYENIHIICLKDIEAIIDDTNYLNVNELNITSTYEKKYLLTKINDKINSTQDLNKKLNLLNIQNVIDKDMIMYNNSETER